MGRGLYRCPPLGAHMDAGRGVGMMFLMLIVIHWAAELRRMAVSWPWLRRHGSCRSRTGFACDFAIHWATVQFVLRVRRSELAFALKVVPLVPVML